MIVLLAMLAFPAHAGWKRLHPATGLELAQAAPSLDEAGCVALAERMDAKVAAKQKPSAQEQEQFAQCIGEFNCDELAAAANAGRVPTEAVSTNAKARYTLRTCGNTSAAGKEPPEPAQSAPGSAFGEKPKSAFQ